MSRSCKLPDCYPTSVNSFNINDTFQNVNIEAVFYSVDLDGDEMDPVSLPIDSYDNNSLNAVGINSSGIFRIDIPSNMQVTVFSEDNFQGISKVFYSNITNLSNLEFSIYSLIIENNSESNESKPAIINSNVVSNFVKPVVNNVQPAIINLQTAVNNTKNVQTAVNNVKPIEVDVINTDFHTFNNSSAAMMDTQKQLEVTNSIITNQMKSERWINGISNTTIVIIIFILLLIIILKK
jgi:hypothetical protein